MPNRQWIFLHYTWPRTKYTPPTNETKRQLPSPPLPQPPLPPQVSAPVAVSQSQLQPQQPKNGTSHLDSHGGSAQLYYACTKANYCDFRCWAFVIISLIIMNHIALMSKIIFVEYIAVQKLKTSKFFGHILAILAMFGIWVIICSFDVTFAIYSASPSSLIYT